MSSWVPQWDQQDGSILLEEKCGSAGRFAEFSESTVTMFHPANISHELISISSNLEATVRIVLSNISQEELGQHDGRGQATVFDHLWAELWNELGSPIYLEESNPVLEFIETLTIGINGPGDFRHLYEEFFMTVHWMWDHVPVKIGSAERSPFSRFDSQDETFEQAEEDILDSTLGVSGSEASLSLVEPEGNEGFIQEDNQPTRRFSSIRDDYDEESVSSQDAATQFFRFDPGKCTLCNDSQHYPSSLHSYLMNDPNREELLGSEKDPDTLSYRIQKIFEDSWNHRAAKRRSKGISLNFLAPCIDACNLRRFFITDGQLFDTCPQAMRPGDIIRRRDFSVGVTEG